MAPPARIVIGDPAKVGEGLQAYVAYKLSVQLSEPLAGLDGLAFNVTRRFSDFVWLRSALHEALPYLVVPALPEKQQLGRFNTEFVEVRQRALQRWMERVAAHPELSGHELYKRFISMPPESFAAMREGSGGTGALVKGAAASGRRTIMKFLKSAGSVASDAIAQVRGTAGASSATAGASRTAEDVSFAELEAYLHAQAPLLAALYNQAAALAVRYREQAQLLLDYGAALRALGQSEGGPVGESLGSVGVASWAASTAAYEQAVCQTEAFVEKLADYVRGTRAVKQMLEARGRASADLMEAAGEVDRLRALLTALASSPAPNAGKERLQAEADFSAAQKQAAEARAYYDKAAAAALSESERLRAGMRADFSALLTDFTSSQLRMELKLAAAWESISAKVAPAAAQEGVGGISLAA